MQKDKVEYSQPLTTTKTAAKRGVNKENLKKLAEYLKLHDVKPDIQNH